MPSLQDLLEDPGPALSALTQRPAGLFVDFDGTISRLARTPDEAIASPPAARSLGSLSGKVAVVCVLSGRRAQDIRDKVGLGDLLYVGNHGAESIDGDVHSISPLAQQHGDAIESLLRELRRLAHVEGMIWEHKGSSAAVHYRAAADPETARRRLASALREAGASGLQTFWGKMILEIRPPVGLHKGHAIRMVVEERGLKGAVFLGDDSTDIDGMEAVVELRRSGRFRGCGVAVVDEGTPAALLDAADYRLDGVGGVERLLERLCEAL